MTAIDHELFGRCRKRADGAGPVVVAEHGLGAVATDVEALSVFASSERGLNLILN